MILGRKLVKSKYNIAWYIGTVLSFLFYFTGIVSLYIFLRRRILKKYISIVLMYHQIHDNNYNRDIAVSILNFENQINYLKRKFDIVSLDKLIDSCKSKDRMVRDLVAITFDDGFKNNYTHAYPILKKNNVPATIFIVTDWIGKKNMLSINEIMDMKRNNLTFGAHTISHVILSKVDKETALLEIYGSKSSLEEILQEEVKYFAYPAGKKQDFTRETLQEVMKAGYKAAFSTENGFITNNSNIFALSRLGIRNYPLFVFKCRVSGIFEGRLFFQIRRLIGLT